MEEIYFLVIVIASYSIVQSIFGVGLLLLGTPTLLIFEYSFSETLWLLLPCSLTISVIQVIIGYRLIEAKKRAIYLIIPTLILGLAIVVTYSSDINITRLAGILLLIIGFIKLSPKIYQLLASRVKKNSRSFYLIIGLVHGVSNMGGGPLSIVMSSIYTKKEIIRANVAYIYLILVSFQLLILSIINFSSFRGEVFWLAPISFLSYIFTSKFISSKVNDRRYVFILNLMVITYGILAIIK